MNFSLKNSANYNNLKNTHMREKLFISNWVCTLQYGCTGAAHHNWKGKDDAGNPVARASVIVKGTSSGTQTNDDGTFSISVPNNRSVLVISSVGMSTQEFQVGQL